MTRKLLVLLGSIVLGLVVGCSGDDGKNDPCSGVECEFGVCNPDTRQCDNADSCQGDEFCLEGFACVDGDCSAVTPCDDDLPCQRGVCERGACVNAESCFDEERCVEGYRCSDGECVVDPCADVECPRGVCNPESSACVNADVCTEQSEDVDCLDGYYCYGQKCELPVDICADVACPRGVCDPAEQECFDAESCESDTDCLEGRYCDDDGSCQTNECDAQMQMCNRGVCNPADASCGNAENCASVDECLDGFSCAEGDCVAEGTECGDPCPGNQLCVYVPEDLIGVCDESPEGCTRALDCVQTRVCVEGTCGTGMPCEADALEPNDAVDTAVSIVDVENNTVDGTVCSGDVDVFAFHTDDSDLFRGILLVDVQVDPVDVGAGDVQVELELPDGTVLDASTGVEGQARIAHEITVLNQGQYYVRVRDGGDVYASGVNYSLFVDMFDEAVIDACANATPLTNGTITENSNSGESFLLGSDCTTPDNAAGENVYSFSIDEPSWVAITAAPAAGVDISMSLRQRCELGDDLACVDDLAADGEEVISTALEPGDYFLVVQGASTDAGGEYDLTFEALPQICDASDATCVGADTSQFCNAERTDFEEVMCDQGCDANTGRCSRLVNDVCYTATDASAGLADSIDWEMFTDDYDPGSRGCVPDSSGTQTDGPDVAYLVDVPADHVLHVTVDFDFGDRGSLYLVENCAMLDTTCLMGANQGGSGQDEELIYFNTSGADEQLYVIADIESDSFGYGTSNIDIEVLPTVCQPNSAMCNGDIKQTCGRLGDGFTDELCTFGCMNGACGNVTNSQCAGAIDLLANGPFTGRIDEYSSSYNPGFLGCTDRSATGPDAAFTVTPAAGEVATVTVTADFDVSLYAATDCGDISGTCVDGSDDIGAFDEIVQFLGDGATTYYVLVDSQFDGAGVFTVEATTQMPSCTPGDALTCSDAMTLEYCTDLGVPADYTCSTTCTGAACDEPRGQICADPIVLQDGDTVSNDFEFPDSVNPGPGTVGTCTFAGGEEATGADHIYALDLTAGDWVFADYTASTSFAILYLLTDCADTTTCAVNTNDGSSGSLVYESTTTQRVYLVMDRTSSAQTSLSFDLNVDIRRQDCTPGSDAFCADGTTLEYCDDLGFTREYTCDGSCTGDSCDMPTGDVCVDAIDVVSGDSVTGDWSTGTNAVTPTAPLDGQCKFDESNEPIGSDDIYRIDLLAGDLLRADLQTTYSGAYVYILESCGDTSTCSDANTLRGAGTVYHYAETDGPVYVVVDSNSSFGSGSTYTLNFDVSQGAVCAPADTTCDAGVVDVCDDAGAAIETTIACAEGCSADACAPDVGSDTCATAPTTSGTVIYSNWDAHTNDVEISSTGCTGDLGDGNDLVYAVNAGAGDVIHAVVQSHGIENVQAYIATDCADPDNTCLSGQDGDSNDRAEVFYAPQQAGTFYVVAEATSSFSDEPFTLSVEVVQQECTPGNYQCSSTGQTMEVCNEHGLFESYQCDGGCTNDECGTPRGQACFDAIPLVDGDSVSGGFDQPDSIDPGSGDVGSCSFGTNDGEGSDTIFSVDMQAGDVLRADYTSTSTYGILYLLGDCEDTTTCIANTDDGTAGSLQYAATTAETVYLVIDRTSSGTTSFTWTLDVQVRAPDCTPGDPTTCADMNTLQYCDSFGFTQDYTCGGTSGTCTSGACDTPTADICYDPLELTDGAMITDDFEGTDDIDMGPGTVGACDFGTDDTPGTDHFYFADLTAGQTITLDYTSSSSYGIVFVMSDCATESSCLANTARGSTATLSYTATVDERVFVVVDRALSGSTTSYDYTMGVTIN